MAILLIDTTTSLITASCSITVTITRRAGMFPPRLIGHCCPGVLSPGSASDGYRGLKLDLVPTPPIRVASLPDTIHTAGGGSD